MSVKQQRNVLIVQGAIRMGITRNTPFQLDPNSNPVIVTHVIFAWTWANEVVEWISFGVMTSWVHTQNDFTLETKCCSHLDLALVMSG
eukprot:2497286-Amphidinium_carterae.1